MAEMNAADYHADQIADAPTLSRSIAQILLTASPLHAWTNHPKLNPNYQADDGDGKFDIGTAAHDLFLAGDDRIAVVSYDDWRTKDAKEQRDWARSEGKIPLLEKDTERVYEMVGALRRQLDAHTADPPLFAHGRFEHTVVWEEDEVICRARLDWLRDDLRTIDDLKTTSKLANPQSWSRTVFNLGYDLQAAFYRRGVFKTTGVTPEFRLAVVETTPPYALSVMGFGPDVYALADRKVQHAIDLWRECMENDSWPGYTKRVAYAELPPWEAAAWLEQEVTA